MKSLALLIVLAAALPAHAAKPNVVLIFVDNIGYGDLGCYGNTSVKTPHVNRLAARGVRCTNFYVGSPSCMPSRGALMTGRHPVRNGLNQQIYQIDELEQTSLPLREKLFPQYMRDLGYVTAMDAGIGRILDRMDALALTERTITIVLSDNGAFMLPGRGLECASNRPLKGGGTMLYDLSNDIGETANRAAQQPEVVDELSATYTQWLADASNINVGDM